MSNDDPNFVSQVQKRLKEMAAGTRLTDIAVTLGIEAVSASDSHVEMALPFRQEVGIGTGVFAAGALIQLADTAATILCSRTVQQRNPDASEEAFFPFAIQMDAHLIGNTNSGRAIARSTLVSAGRTVMVAQTPVRDEYGQDLLLLTSTHIIRAVHG